MKVNTTSSFISAKNIELFEKEYAAKYVFETCLKARDGGWANFPAAVFYTEKAHPQGSNYFAVYHNGDKIWN